MAKTKKHAPGLYEKATQQEAVKLAGGSPRNRRFTARAKRAAPDDNKGDALSDDAISTTDPRKTVINYGDDNIECDVSANIGINDEDAEEDGDNDEEAENEEEGDGDNDQSGNENEDGNEDDSEEEDEDDDEGQDEDYDDINDEDYKGDLYDDDESDDDSLVGGKYRVPSARGKGAGRKPHPNRPPKPNTDGMTEAEAFNIIKSWESEWKRTKDKARRSAANVANTGEGSIGSSTTFTGVCDLTLRTMSEVEQYPLCIGHSFPTKDRVLLRIAEEANLFGVRIKIKRSDSHQIHVCGVNDDFYVRANYGDTHRRWTVTKSNVRIGRTVYSPVTNLNPPTAKDQTDGVTPPPEPEGDMAGILDGEGDADGENNDAISVDADQSTEKDKKSKKQKKVRQKSPIKSRWLIPIVKAEVSQRPNIPNKELKALLKDYVKDIFLTPSLLQQTRTTIRKEVFGDADTNVMYVRALERLLHNSGHDFEFYVREKDDVLHKCEEIALSQHIALKKVEGTKLMRTEKIEYIKQWKHDNKVMLEESGLCHNSSETHRFVSGVFLSLQQARHTVPFLQSVFQADAAHMNFGKYTLYSCYGNTANGNTFPVAIAIIFGNEDKEGWTRFWKFVLRIHPTIQEPKNTIITDQQKGSIPALADVLPAVVNFFCSFHRRENIKKFVKGGTGEYSCWWFYNLLLKCKLPTTLTNLRFKHSGEIQDNALRFINSIDDHQQFPAARCALHTDACMFQRTSSSSVESMNRANSSIRDRTAIDPINSIILLLDLEGKRYNGHRDNAWSCTDILTPYGKKLLVGAFHNVNFRDFEIAMSQQGDMWCCHINRIVSTNVYTCHIPMVANDYGSHFGTCTCGVPKVDGIPCMHMVAICKSNRIEGLNENNIMPFWCHTSHWRKQYPEGTSVDSSHITMLQLKENNEASKELKLCPGFSAPRKGGRPSHNKRHKSCMEIASEKKKAKTGGKTAAKLQLRGKTLQGKAIKKKTAASTKTKLGKKKEKVQSKSPQRKGKKDVTTKATKKSVGPKKPTVTKAKTGTSVKKKIGSPKKIGSGKYLSPGKVNELVAKGHGNRAGLRRSDRK
jgi:hypothetical protein